MTPRIVIFPAAGLGTRFLPATKAQPKEMMPLIDKPLIQYGIEEAAKAGLSQVIIVTGRGKAAIEDHFDVSFELEQLLKQKGRTDLLGIVHEIASGCEIAYIRQREALGLGHAILRTRHLVRDEPFAVILSDDIIDADVPCIGQLLRVFELVRNPVIAVMEVDPTEVSSYGIVDVEPAEVGDDRLFLIRNLVEKPNAGSAPSNLAIIGRYVLTSDLFESLATTSPGAGNEIQLTDALRDLLAIRPIYAYRFEGTRYDAGDKLGFIKATVGLGLKREGLGDKLRQYLTELLSTVGDGNGTSVPSAFRPA